jgi:hypothetical protein
MVNGEWPTMMSTKLITDNSHLSIKVQNLEVSDTTGDEYGSTSSPQKLITKKHFSSTHEH